MSFSPACYFLNVHDTTSHRPFFPADARRPAATANPGPLAVSEWVSQNLHFDPDPHQTAVLNPEIRRGLLNCTRQWGKSTIAAAKAVHHAATRPGSLTIVVSPSARQSAELVRKTQTFAHKLGIKPRGDGSNQISLLFPNRSRIVGLPGMEDTIRGFSAVSLLLIDEAARVSDEIYQAVRPMLAVGNGALWLMSTPAGKSGFFWEAVQQRDWTTFTIPATECPRITSEFLENERRKIPDRHSRQEYMCEFTETENAVFSRDLIEAAFSSDFEPLKL